VPALTPWPPDTTGLSKLPLVKARPVTARLAVPVVALPAVLLNTAKYLPAAGPLAVTVSVVPVAPAIALLP